MMNDDSNTIETSNRIGPKVPDQCQIMIRTPKSKDRIPIRTTCGSLSLDF